MDVLARKTLPPFIDGLTAGSLLALPEKVIQFGTGVLLRALPDYFIDRANKRGVFNGRIIMVKSTDTGSIAAFKQQDGIYTHLIRGLVNGKQEEAVVINTAISRVLTTNAEWPRVLDCAGQPELQVVISNTTEVGIRYIPEKVFSGVPVSYPGKLLAFLYQRYTVFRGDDSKGMVIIPTELVPDNGTLLHKILVQLGHYNQLPAPFFEWLEKANTFCNSLVDRIVPGKLPAAEQDLLEQQLGYHDALMIMSESYRLWAIETDQPRVREVLSFADLDEGVLLAPDIYPYRELKLRILNGSHTFSCGLAYLAGFETVREAMANPHFERFVHQLMTGDIVPCLPDARITLADATAFAQQTLDRFRNPFLAHRWLNITLQYSSKMKMRNVPLLQRAGSHFPRIPEAMCLGFAAFLLFMKARQEPEGGYFGFKGNQPYPVQDDHAGYFAAKWASLPLPEFTESVLQDTELWGTDLTLLPGFLQRVNVKLQELLSSGALTVLAQTHYT